jgi:hypothetical protein
MLSLSLYVGYRTVDLVVVSLWHCYLFMSFALCKVLINCFVFLIIRFMHVFLLCIFAFYFECSVFSYCFVYCFHPCT